VAFQHPDLASICVSCPKYGKDYM